MFSNINKPTFGGTTPTSSFGFGSSGTSMQPPPPFGQSQFFGKPSTGGFGTTTPLFGVTPSQTSTLFTSPAVSSFGSNTAQHSGFGSGLFGQPQNVGSSNNLFSSPGSTFGQTNKSSGFGFGGPSSTTLFGQQQQQNFQASTSSAVFGTPSGFGATPQMGTVVKFNPLTGTDTMQKSGITHSINTKHHCITCMKEYESKSLEELRWEDYQSNRKGPQQQSTFGAAPFGSVVSTAPSLFGQTENKPAFGQTSTFGSPNTGFGISSQPNQSSLFGKPSTGFGVSSTATNFGFNTATPAFGSASPVKPFGAQSAPTVFGAAPTTQQSGFGGSFFGQTNTQNTSGYFSKPSTQSTFTNAQQPQQPVFAFGQPTAQPSFFQTPKSTPGFGGFGQATLATSGFGQSTNAFSTQTAQNPFSTFQKPTQSTFGQPIQSGFGMGTQPTGASFFGGNKPLFGAPNQANVFNQSGGGFLMPQQQPTVQNTNVGLESTSLQEFQSIVQNIYDPFPHYPFLTDAVLSDTQETTNPAALKEIIEHATMRVTPIEKNISKYRTLIKVRETKATFQTKYALLDDITEKKLFNGMGISNINSKRLILRRNTPKSQKELVEEYKRMSTVTTSNKRSLFKNIQQVDEENLDPNIGQDSGHITQMSTPKKLFGPGPFFEDSGIFRSKRNVPVLEANLQDKSFDEETQIEEVLVLNKTKNFALIDLSDSDSDDFEENIVNRLSMHESSNTSAGTDTHEISTASNASQNTTPKSLMSNKSSATEKSVKSVRFVESDTSSSDIVSESENLYPSLKEFQNISTSTSRLQTSNESATKANYIVKLTRPEYYTLPKIEDLYKYRNEKGEYLVKGFTIGRVGYGSVYFNGIMNVDGLDLDELIDIKYREITVYPNDSIKPPVGHGLNRPAQVTLEHVWPREKGTNKPIKDPKEIAQQNFIDRLTYLSERQNACFLDYRPDTGAWMFSVDHFSTYEYNEGEDDEFNMILEKRKLEEDLLTNKMQDQERNTETIRRGLGGFPVEDRRQLSIHTSITSMDSSVGIAPKEFDKTVFLTRPPFFDDESVSDDVSSSDVGIIQHFSSTRVPPSEIKINTQPISKLKTHDIQYFPILNKQFVTPIERTLLHHRSYADMKVFKGRSFKVGWGIGFTLVTTTAIMQNYGSLPNLAEDDVIANISIIDVGSTVCGDAAVMDLEEHLKHVLHSTIKKIDQVGLPLFQIETGFQSLVTHQQIAQNLDETQVGTQISYYREIWDLCVSLWGPDANNATAKRDLFSNWLEKTCSSYYYGELRMVLNEPLQAIKNLVAYLTGHKIHKASTLALEMGFPNLSLLISQSQKMTKELLRAQTEQWKHNGTNIFMERDLLKLYMLLGGIPTTEGVNVCENLDWKRCLAIHLWYMCLPGTALDNAVDAYKHGFEVGGYAKKPNPEKYKPINESVFDILYHIMILNGSSFISLETMLHPSTHTIHILDYRLSWLLLQTFKSLQIGTIPKPTENAIHLSFASQLEHIGLWKWSIFVLLFIEETTLRYKMILSTLERNLELNLFSDINRDTVRYLVKEFHLPPKLIHIAMSYKAKSLGKSVECFRHFVLTESWSEAHDYALLDLIPELIICGQSDDLLKLLSALLQGKNYINGWNIKVGTILDFLELQHQINKNKETPVQMEDGIEKIPITKSDILNVKSRLYSLCHRFKQFPVENAKLSLAVAEISRSIAIFMSVFYGGFGNCLKADNSLEYLLKTLLMPADYSALEMRKCINNYAVID